MPLDPKQTLLGKIEGLKISNEAFSNVSFFNSFPSLNSANSLTFLTDFFKLFFGGERIKNDLVRFLATELKSLGEDLLRYYKKHIV
jgi:predicted MPP superfamily phosphohydrolase